MRGVARFMSAFVRNCPHFGSPQRRQRENDSSKFDIRARFCSEMLAILGVEINQGKQGQQLNEKRLRFRLGLWGNSLNFGILSRLSSITRAKKIRCGSVR